MFSEEGCAENDEDQNVVIGWMEYYQDSGWGLCTVTADLLNGLRW